MARLRERSFSARNNRDSEGRTPLFWVRQSAPFGGYFTKKERRPGASGWNKRALHAVSSILLPPMRIFITGASGFVGAHSAMELLKAGHEVRLLLRDPSAVQRYYKNLGFQVEDIVQGDMTDADLVRSNMRACDAVLHCAAMVTLGQRNAEQVIQTNVGGVKNVVGGAHELGIPNILYVSSSLVFFHPGTTHIDESSPLGTSSNPYSRSKVISEQYVRELQESRAPIQVTYPTSVIGPDDPKFSEGNKALRLFAELVMLITTTGLQYIDVRDLAHTHRLLLERGCPSTPQAARYLTTGHFQSWADIADLLEAATGRRVRRISAPPGLLLALGSLCDKIKHFVPFEFPMTREAMTYVTQWAIADASKLQSELDISFRELEATYGDTIKGMRDAKHMKPAPR
jgi:dihydroflavonol-4-reductase